jgi:hypothetical protein
VSLAHLEIMYICRLPEDILLDIFQTVHDEVDSLGYPYHHTTAALARTCRLFKEPALNTLWKKVSGLEPLISCFPEGVSIKTRGGFVSAFGRFHMTRNT